MQPFNPEEFPVRLTSSKQPRMSPRESGPIYMLLLLVAMITVVGAYIAPRLPMVDPKPVLLGIVFLGLLAACIWPMLFPKR